MGVLITAGDVYTVAGSSSGSSGHSGDGGAATSALLDNPIAVALDSAGDLFIVDSSNNRIQEVAAASGSQYGQSMTADDIYTVAGSSSGALGHSGDGGAATSALLSAPGGVYVDSSGDIFIADSANNRVQDVAAASGTQWGQSMTANDVYTVAGSSSGSSGDSGDGGRRPLRFSNPTAVIEDSAGNLYVADSSNNRVQEVAAATGTQWGQSVTADEIYTIAGSSSGTSGTSGDGGPATSALLSTPTGLAFDSAGDLYIADRGNNRVQEVAASRGSDWQWGQSVAPDSIYTVAGSPSGTVGLTGNGSAATSATFDAVPESPSMAPATCISLTRGNNEIREVPTGYASPFPVFPTAGAVTSMRLTGRR